MKVQSIGPSNLRSVKKMFLSHVIKAVVDEGVKRSRNSMRGDAVQRRVMMGGNMTDQEAARKGFDADADRRLLDFSMKDRDRGSLGKTGSKTKDNIVNGS